MVIFIRIQWIGIREKRRKPSRLSGEDFPEQKNNPLRDGEILLTEENHMNIY